jgi:hypothetical protein
MQVLIVCQQLLLTTDYCLAMGTAELIIRGFDDIFRNILGIVKGKNS